MAEPNIINVISIVGKTDVLRITTTPTEITSNPINSNKVYKINSFLVSNNDTTTDYAINVGLYRNEELYDIAKNIIVPIGETVTVLSRDLGIYLQEGDSLRCVTTTSNKLTAICSYEIISG